MSLIINDFQPLFNDCKVFSYMVKYFYTMLIWRSIWKT
nr:MAG TPA: hypothetical protein [Caudoviricetes sp.]